MALHSVAIVGPPRTPYTNPCPFPNHHLIPDPDPDPGPASEPNPPTTLHPSKGPFNLGCLDCMYCVQSGAPVNEHVCRATLGICIIFTCCDGLQCDDCPPFPNRDSSSSRQRSWDLPPPSPSSPPSYSASSSPCSRSSRETVSSKYAAPCGARSQVRFRRRLRLRVGVRTGSRVSSGSG